MALIELTLKPAWKRVETTEPPAESEGTTVRVTEPEPEPEPTEEPGSTRRRRITGRRLLLLAGVVGAALAVRRVRRGLRGTPRDERVDVDVETPDEPTAEQ